MLWLADDVIHTLLMGTNSPVHLETDVLRKVLQFLLKLSAAQGLVLQNKRPDKAFKDLPLKSVGAN